ncbi:hypothetical protein M422DRAFT_257861 [Sphaerobolus stellatus SS14]|uniref:Uncharacterized protein n=1 Tax=Sphaerobolus stellatus (strain SS14) TaxID=990650 RepID=A0A0C9VMR7_SPHS4|nr:hypothetical protein M422DRAFT_257861 [Sphaerobolus stellatus SS14]
MFKNMAVTTAQLVQEKYDGCPLIRLDDDPELLTHFFQALMGRMQVVNSLEDYPVRALGILRLSHKYKAARYRNKAIRWFEERIPDTLEEALDTTPHFATWVCWIGGSIMPSPRYPSPIEIFQECDLDRFSPYTFSVACLNGHSILSNMKNLRLSTVIIKISKGREHLQVLYRRNLFKIVQTRHSECKGATCIKELRSAWLETLLERDDIMWLAHPYFLTEFAGQNQYTPDNEEYHSGAYGYEAIPHDISRPCRLCHNLWLLESERLMEEAWVELPKIFELPS